MLAKGTEPVYGEKDGMKLDDSSFSSSTDFPRSMEGARLCLQEDRAGHTSRSRLRMGGGVEEMLPPDSKKRKERLPCAVV